MNPKYIQALYRRNRRRAVRKIIGDKTQQCNEDPNALADHFYNSALLTCDNSIFDDWEVAANELIIDNITPAEVLNKLSRAENTAPGLGRLTFQHWRSIDPDDSTLAAIFSICTKLQKVPDDWKTSKTVFIPKKEHCNSLFDWRPISLCNTIAKLFTGCLTKRLIDWASNENVLCPAQKGFMPYDGAFENNYVFSQKLLYGKKKLY